MMISSATLQSAMMSYDLTPSLMASAFMKLFGCIKMSRNFIAISSLLLSIFDFRPGAILFLSLPITGSPRITLLFLFSDKGFTSYLLSLPVSEGDVVLMVGVVGPLLSPTRSLTELIDELLLFDAVSDRTVFSFAVRDGLVSNNLPKETLKMESVGILGVDS